MSTIDRTEILAVADRVLTRSWGSDKYADDLAQAVHALYKQLDQSDADHRAMDARCTELEAQRAKALDHCDEMMEGKLSPSYIVAYVREALGWDPVPADFNAAEAFPDHAVATEGASR